MLDRTNLPHAAVRTDGVVEGYASLFGTVDQANDMVMPGAFADTLRLRGVRRIPMLFQHDPSEPIGVWLQLTEDWRGLYARGRLIPEVVRARELWALLAAGTSDGLSIGFRTVKARVDPKTRVRKLYHVDLWEISIVTFPLLPEARVHPVKGTEVRPCVGARHASPLPDHRRSSTPTRRTLWTTPFTTPPRKPKPASVRNPPPMTS